MKAKILSTLVLLLTLMAVTSCNSYDKKDCEKLIEKIEDDDIDGKDHLSIVYQLDGLLSYDEDKLDEIDDMDSKSDRCDEFENFTDSDEFEYTCKILLHCRLRQRQPAFRHRQRGIQEHSDQSPIQKTLQALQ